MKLHLNSLLKNTIKIAKVEVSDRVLHNHKTQKVEFEYKMNGCVESRSPISS